MADTVRIDQLPEAVPLDGSELVPVQQDGTTRRTDGLASRGYVNSVASDLTTDINGVASDLSDHETEEADTHDPHGIQSYVIGEVGSAFVAPKVGYFFGPPSAGHVDAPLTNERLYAIPLMTVGVVVDQIVFRMNSAGHVGESGSVVRAGIYSATSEGEPGNLLVDGGTVDAGSTHGNKTISLSDTTLPKGLVWLACVAQSAPSTPPTLTGQEGVPYEIGSSVVTRVLLSYSGHYHQENVSGALPSAWGSTFTSTDAPFPRLAVRIKG